MIVQKQAVQKVLLWVVIYLFTYIPTLYVWGNVFPLVMPDFVLLFVCVLSIKSDKLFPLWAVIPLGIVSDVFSGSMLGYHAFFYVLIWLVFQYRIVPFRPALLGMVFLCMGVYFLLYPWIFIPFSASLLFYMTIKLWITFILFPFVEAILSVVLVKIEVQRKALIL